MSRDEDDREEDRLSRLLRTWAPPAIPDSLDDRMLQSYRRLVSSPLPPLWQRIFSARIQVPLPLAAAVILLLVFSVGLALRRPAAGAAATTPSQIAPVQAAQKADPPLVSETSLAGFEPVDELQVTVMGGQEP